MHVRVIELPTCRMAVSGPSPDPDPFTDDGVLRRFDRWFTRRPDPLRMAPRDLMWFDEEAKALVWGYLLAPDEDGHPWPTVPFGGGLYAAAVSVDTDDADGERVLAAIRQWVDATPLQADESPERPVAFHVTSPESVSEVLGHHQLEILLPVRVP